MKKLVRRAWYPLAASANDPAEHCLVGAWILTSRYQISVHIQNTHSMIRRSRITTWHNQSCWSLLGTDLKSAESAPQILDELPREQTMIYHDSPRFIMIFATISQILPVIPITSRSCSPTARRQIEVWQIFDAGIVPCAWLASEGEKSMLLTLCQEHRCGLIHGI